MIKKFFLWLTLIVSILSFLYYIGLKVQEYRFLENTVYDFHEKTSFRNYADSISLALNNDTVVIQADMTETFENLTVEKQYEALYFYATTVYSFWQYGLQTPSFWNVDLHFYGMTDSDTYKLALNTDTCCTVLSRCTLTINGDLAYDFQQFEQKLSQVNKDDAEYKYAREVIEYSEYFFNLLTSYGRDFNSLKDVSLILNAVFQKYGITLEQFMDLYKRYAFVADVNFLD